MRDRVYRVGNPNLLVFERKRRDRNWLRFSMTRRGRMSWADWFTMARARAASALNMGES